MGEPFMVREGLESDLPFVKASWRDTFYTGGRGAQGAERSAYHDEMTRVFERIFKHARVVVSCDLKDPDVIVGFAVHTGQELHFVYVRKDFRGHGVARDMLERLPIKRFTFTTYIGEERLKPAKRGWAFTPKWTLY